MLRDELLLGRHGEGGSGAGWPAPGRPAPERAVMALAGPGVLVTALADDAVALRRRLGVD